MSASLYFANIGSKVQDSIVRAYQKAYGEVWVNADWPNGPSKESLEKRSHFDVPAAGLKFDMPLVASFTTRKGAAGSGYAMNTVTKAGVDFTATPPYVQAHVPDPIPYFWQDEVLAKSLAEENIGIANINPFMDLVNALTSPNVEFYSRDPNITSDMIKSSYIKRLQEAVKAYEPNLVRD